MRITLSSLKAPLLSRDGLSDEPHAWASREYLRKNLIGKPVTFRIDYRVDSLNRSFATVFTDQSSSLNLQLVNAGMVRVRKPTADSEKTSPEFDALLAAEEKAAAAHLALHNTTTPPNLRRLPAQGHVLLDPGNLVDWCKGKKIKAVVEYVANGSALKLLLRRVPLSSDKDLGDRSLTVCLSGIQCPGFRKVEDDKLSSQPTPLPYALNAKFLTELRLLHRDVNVSVEGLDRNGMLFATIEDPKAKLYIGEELLRAGFARTVAWSIDFTSRAPALRAAERAARDRQLGVWKGFQPTKTSVESFSGKCIEVISGDMITVLDDTTRTVKRISLASTRATRPDRPGRDRSVITTGPAADAKEALRKKLIGRRVNVKIEYTRPPSDESARKESMVFATVGREGDKKHSDVALPMISNGLLSVVRHRGEEDRATNYEEYLERQTEAMEAKRGIHGDPRSTTVRINNLTGPDAKRRSRDILAGLQRNGPHKGMIEYVSSASRYRVFLPSESMLITLALRAVRCPASTRRSYAPDGSILEEVPGEEHGDVAADFARESFMQREVEVDVANVDRVGAFLGNFKVMSASGGKTDASAMLLTEGHGYIHESFDPSRDTSGSRYIAIEKAAKEAKKGVWATYVEPSTEDTSASQQRGAQPTTFVAVVCEIGFGGRIFVHNRDTYKTALASVEDGLGKMSLDSAAETPLAGLRPGLLVAAKFSADNQWYRAKILFVHKDTGGVDVRFIDYGNEERVDAKDIRRLSSAATFINAAPIAVEVGLGNIIVPDKDDVCGVPAGEYLRELVFNKDITVSMTGREGPSKVVGDVLIASAGDSSSSKGSVSVREELLRAGLARIVRKRDRASRAAFKELRPFEEVGIASRQYLWNYGEAFESDCDEDQS